MRDHAEARAAMTDILQNSTSSLASQEAARNLKFEREDWSLFRTVEGLQQKAGVAKHKLSRLVVKELADNGLDSGAEVRVGKLPKGSYFVEDGGPGIDGAPEEIARLASSASPAQWSRPNCCGCRCEALSAMAYASLPALFSPPRARSSSSHTTSVLCFARSVTARRQSST